MSHNVKEELDRMSSSELCDLLRSWIHSLSDDRFSRVQSVVRLESEFREKVGNRRRSNEGNCEPNGSCTLSPSKLSLKRSSDTTSLLRSPVVANSTSGNDLADWICVFCKETSHARGLGDLFGPYYISGGSNTTGTSGSNTTGKSGSNTTGKSGSNTSGTSGSKPDVGPSKPRVPPKKMKVYEVSDSDREIWLHDSCLSWASGVYLVGHQIKNVEDIIKNSSHNICSVCHLNGANIGCMSKGCQKLFHYLCAKESNCLMDETTFSVTCSNHHTSDQSRINNHHASDQSRINNHHSTLDQIDLRKESTSFLK